jgi:nicotinamidase-related amidase
MRRRTFIGHLSRTPIVAAAGTLAAPGPVTNAVTFHSQTATPTAVAPIDPRRAVLLVMDYQSAWIETLSDSDALLTRAASTIAIAHERGLRVAYVRVAFTEADYAAVPTGNVIFTQLASQPGALDADAPRTAIDARVAPELGDKVIRKTRVGAFARTDLDGWLRALGIDTLILAGISTSGVVLSTVCDAADRDYRVIVLADACADRDPDIQDTLIAKVFPQRADVITVAELPALIQPGP